MIMLAQLRRVFLSAWNSSCVACKSKELWKFGFSGGLCGQPSCLGGHSRGITSPCHGTAFPGEVTLTHAGAGITWMRVVLSAAATLDTTEGWVMPLSPALFSGGRCSRCQVACVVTGWILLKGWSSLWWVFFWLLTLNSLCPLSHDYNKSTDSLAKGIHF